MGPERSQPSHTLQRHLGNVARALLLVLAAMLAIIGAHPPAAKDSLWNIGSSEEFIDDRQVQIDFTNCRDACAFTTATFAEMRRRWLDRIGQVRSVPPPGVSGERAIRSLE
jgi:hypothetical protein